MKTILIILLLPVVCFSQIGIDYKPVVDLIDTTITGTNSTSYSSAFNLDEYNDFNIFSYDTAGNDSSAYDIILEMCTNKDTADWAIVDTFSIGQAVDSTWRCFRSQKTQRLKYGRLKGTGTSDNATDSASEIKVKHLPSSRPK